MCFDVKRMKFTAKNTVVIVCSFHTTDYLSQNQVKHLDLDTQLPRMGK